LRSIGWTRGADETHRDATDEQARLSLRDYVRQVSFGRAGRPSVREIVSSTVASQRVREAHVAVPVDAVLHPRGAELLDRPLRAPVVAVHEEDDGVDRGERVPEHPRLQVAVERAAPRDRARNVQPISTSLRSSS
jgi:hypothetical protein